MELEKKTPVKKGKNRKNKTVIQEENSIESDMEQEKKGKNRKNKTVIQDENIELSFWERQREKKKAAAGKKALARQKIVNARTEGHKNLGLEQKFLAKKKEKQKTVQKNEEGSSSKNEKSGNCRFSSNEQHTVEHPTADEESDKCQDVLVDTNCVYPVVSEKDDKSQDVFVDTNCVYPVLSKKDDKSQDVFVDTNCVYPVLSKKDSSPTKKNVQTVHCLSEAAVSDYATATDTNPNLSTSTVFFSDNADEEVLDDAIKSAVSCKATDKNFVAEITDVNSEDSDPESEENFAKKQDFSENNNEILNDDFEALSPAERRKNMEDASLVSLFDHTKKFRSLEKNLQHMRHKYSLVVPQREYCTDVPGLLYFMHRKIILHHQCLYCNRIFESAAACRQHMLDKNHTQIVNDAEELKEFYDTATLDKQVSEINNSFNIFKARKGNFSLFLQRYKTRQEIRVNSEKAKERVENDEGCEEGKNSIACSNKKKNKLAIIPVRTGQVIRGRFHSMRTTTFMRLAKNKEARAMMTANDVDELKAKAARLKQNQVSNIVANRAMAFGSGTNKALAGQYVHRQKAADDKRKRANVHHAGSHFVMGHRKILQKGKAQGMNIGRKGGAQGARLQAARMIARKQRGGNDGE